MGHVRNELHLNDMLLSIPLCIYLPELLIFVDDSQDAKDIQHHWHRNI